MQNTDVQRVVIPVLSASNFVIGMGAFMVIGILNPISEGLGMSTAATGWVMTAYALGYAVLSPVLVAVTGRIGRRRVLAAGLGIFAVANIVCAMAPTGEVLFAARVAAAAGAGLVTPVSSAVAAGLSAPERRARALASVFFGLTLAQVLGVPVGSFIAYTFGWRLAFILVGLLAVPCLWLIWTRVPAGLSFQSARLADLGAVLREGRTMLAVAFTTSFLTAIYVVYTYLAPLLATGVGFGRDGISLALLIFGVGAVLGNVLGGRVADRIGPWRTLLILAVAQVVIMPFFSTLPVPVPALFVAIVLWSVFGWSFMAPQQARLLSIAPEAASVVLALNAAAIYVGAALGSAIGSVVLERFGLGALGIAGGAAGLVAVLNILISRGLSGK